MSYIEIPNLPKNDVSVVIIDGRVSNEIEIGLQSIGIKILKTSAYPLLYDAISHHPDIFLHHIGGKRIVFAPGTDRGILGSLLDMGFELIKGNIALSLKYPDNIAYNAARVGNFLIHNLKYTDSVLKSELIKEGVEFIHVNQGYAKCSVSIVDENSIITSDKGIYKAAEEKGIEVLLIDTDEAILLPGLDRGFIGGCSGLLGKGKWAVTGNIDFLKSGQLIRDFLYARNIEPFCINNGPIIDVGSILPILTE